MEGIVNGVFITPEALQSIINTAVKQATEAVVKAFAEQAKPQKERYTYKEFREAYDVCDATIRNWSKHELVSIEALGNRRYVHILNNQAIQTKINGRVTRA